MVTTTNAFTFVAPVEPTAVVPAKAPAPGKAPVPAKKATQNAVAKKVVKKPAPIAKAPAKKIAKPVAAKTVKARHQPLPRQRSKQVSSRLPNQRRRPSSKRSQSWYVTASRSRKPSTARWPTSSSVPANWPARPKKVNCCEPASRLWRPWATTHFWPR